MSFLVRASLLLLCSCAALRSAEVQNDPMSPEKSAASFTVANDLVIEQLLAEPLIAQPVFLNFDERGRMWVVEYRQYPSPAGLRPVSHDQFWRAVYDKVPPAPPKHFKGADRISIHEDTDGDGTFDKHKVFVDGLNIVTAVERGRGGVWVLNPPYLLFYPDRNADDVPDADPVVHLAGFGLEDTHSVANSLRWGPDGWLYGAHGSTVTSHITRPGVDAPPVYIQGQGIWRYHPETRRFELFAEGGGNAFGVEIDAKGRIFSGHNGGDTRGFHYMQGAYLQKGFEKHGPLSNPYAFGYFAAMPHQHVERFTHNFIIYDGGHLPQRYAGKLFGIEPLQGRVVLSEISPDGSSFRTRDIERPVTSSDSWFRPVDIKAGPDGAIYLCDWYDRQITHTSNTGGNYDASTGRIYRLRGKEAAPVAKQTLAGLSGQQLVAHLDDANKWVRQTALRLLGDLHDVSLAPQLRKELAGRSGQFALETLWALHACGGFTEGAALEALDHGDPFVRMWAVRLLGDESRVTPPIASRFVALAQSEPNIEVRNQLACSARRLPSKECLQIIQQLVTQKSDADDSRQPLLIWWALEAKVGAHPDEVIALFESASMWREPLVEKHLLSRLMRRFAQAGTRHDLLACARLFDLSPSADYTRVLTEGFAAAFKGRPMTGFPEELVAAMERHHVDSMAVRLRQLGADAVDTALQTIANENASAETRIEALSILSEVSLPKSVPVVLRVVKNAPGGAVRTAAIRALQLHDDPGIARALIEQFHRFDAEAQSAALAVLSGRASFSLQLAQGVKAGSIKAEVIPPSVVRKMRLHKDDELRQLAAQLWPNVGGASVAILEKRIAEVAIALREGTGDPWSGQPLFDQRCGACHALFGRGGQIGPDLTAFERSNLENMLLNIVNPNAEIREGYENYLVTTKSGRLLSGFLVERDDRMIVIRGPDGQNTSITADDLEEMKPAGMSLMPEGLLDGLDPQQLRDLFAYLRSTQPLVPKPAR